MQAGARAEQRAIPAKGLTGPRLRRPHVLGHGDVRRCPSLTYIAPDAAADALRWRHSTLDLAARGPQRARPRRRGVPVADDPRAGVLGLLAGGHGGVPHQRRHRRRGRAATSPRPATRRSSAGPGSSCSSRPRGCGARSATTTPSGALPHRRRHRARRVHARSSTTTSTRTSWRPRNLRARRGRRRAPPRARGRARRRRGGGRGLARRRRPRWSSPSTTSSACTRRPRASRATRPWDFDGTPARPVPAAAALPVLRALPSQVVKQADLVLALLPLRRRASPPSRRRATSTTTRRSPSATRRCRRAIQAIVAAEVGHLDLAYDYFGETAFIDLRDLDRQHATTACTSRRWPGPGWPRCAGFGGMRDHGDRLAFAPAAARAPDAPDLPPALPRPAACGSTCARTGRRYEVVDGEGLTVLHHGEEVELEPGLPVERAHRARRPRAAAAPAAGARAPAAARRGLTRRACVLRALLAHERQQVAQRDVRVGQVQPPAWRRAAGSA